MEKAVVAGHRVAPLHYSDGAFCTASVDDGSCHIFSETGDLLQTFPRIHNSEISSIASIRAGGEDLIATGSSYGIVRLWGFADHGIMQKVQEFDTSMEARPVISIALSLSKPDRKLFFSGDSLIDAETGREPEGILLASVSADKCSAKLWDVKSGLVLRKFSDTGRVTSVLLNADGRILLTGSIDGVAIWDVDTGVKRHTFSHDVAMALSPDERTLVTTSGSTAFLWKDWNVQADASVIQTCKGHYAQINSVAFRPNDVRYFVTGSDDKSAKLWKVGSEIALFTFRLSSPILSVAFSSSGSNVLICSGSGNAELWDLSLKMEPLTGTISPFFLMLEEANNDVQVCNPYTLLEDLGEKVSDVQELRLFYTLVNASLKKKDITQGQRDNFLVSVLEKAAGTFRFDQESHVVAFLRLALKKAEEDGIISSVKSLQLEESYAKANVFADYRFLSLVETVQQQTKRISGVENYAKAIDDRLRTSLQRRAAVGLVCALVPVFGSYIGAVVESACIDALEGIVDFIDEVDVEKAISKVFNSTVTTELKSWRDKPLTDLIKDDYFIANPGIVPVVAIMKVSHSVSGPAALPDSILKEKEETVDSVLAELRLSHYKQAFDENGIELVDDLKLLSLEDLKDMRITKIGERNRMMAWIQQHSNSS